MALNTRYFKDISIDFTDIFVHGSSRESKVVDLRHEIFLFILFLLNCCIEFIYFLFLLNCCIFISLIVAFLFLSLDN